MCPAKRPLRTLREKSAANARKRLFFSHHILEFPAIFTKFTQSGRTDRSATGTARHPLKP